MPDDQLNRANAHHLDAITAADSAVLAAINRRQHTVDQARAAGVPWEAIGNTLGVSRQAAQQRYGRT